MGRVGSHLNAILEALPDDIDAASREAAVQGGVDAVIKRALFLLAFRPLVTQRLPLVKSMVARALRPGGWRGGADGAGRVLRAQSQRMTDEEKPPRVLRSSTSFEPVTGPPVLQRVMVRAARRGQARDPDACARVRTERFLRGRLLGAAEHVAFHEHPCTGSPQGARPACRAGPPGAHGRRALAATTSAPRRARRPR